MKSKQKICTTIFTMGSEFMACVYAVQEVVQLMRFFENLSIAKNSKGPMILYYNIQVAITYTKDPK